MRYCEYYINHSLWKLRLFCVVPTSWIKRFILYHNKRHPLEMAEKEINAFLIHLAVKGKVASSTQNQALSAILFLYREALQREVGELKELIWAIRMLVPP